MYKCASCDAVFEHPAFIHERHGLDSPPYEQVSVCPVCGDHDIANAVQCDCCGEYTIDRCIKTDDGRYYCENCYVTILPEDEPHD